jgi:MobA-like NTP transferase domain
MTPTESQAHGAGTDNGSPGPTLVVLAAGQATRYGGGVKPLAPVGLAGEAVIDVLASDALAAGFSGILLVISPQTGTAIRYHVERTWPGSVEVGFAVQEVPRGTVDAVLTATTHLGAGRSFGVANADDLPGEPALSLLAGHLAGDSPDNAIVTFRLRDSLVGDTPVTRGIAEVGADGFLRGLDERRKVSPRPDGRIVADDGRQPADLNPDSPVSMNLWGFRPAMRPVFEAAMVDAGEDEVLLPVVVGDVLAGRLRAGTGADRVLVHVAPGRCIGVTHAGDVTLVQAELAAAVGRGERAAQLWAAVPKG